MLKIKIKFFKVIALSILLIFFSCKSKAQDLVKIAKSPQIEISKDAKWSDKMALTLMKLHPEAYMIDGAKAPKWDYVHALVLHSFGELYKKNQDSRYADYIKNYVNILIQNDGTIKTYEIEKYNIDMIAAGRLLFNLYETTQENRYLIAMQTLKKQLEGQPRTSTGGFWHKQIYTNQMWLDGLYMGQPFYTQYTTTFENGDNLDDVVKQFEEIQMHATDPKTGLLYHGWDEKRLMPWANKVTGNSPNFWSRALGWYAMALVDVLDYFPKDHPKQKELVGYLNNICASLAKFQDKSGLWYQVTDKGGEKGNYLEGSGSSMFAYAFAKGANKGYLPRRYKKLATKAFDGIITKLIKVDGDGSITITEVCAVAGLGGTPYRDGSYEYYVNERKKDNDPKATGPFILAALELNR